MSEQKELYSINRKKGLVEAAKSIKEYCLNHRCVDCPFHHPEVWEECAISSRDYLDVTYPQTWEV